MRFKSSRNTKLALLERLLNIERKPSKRMRKKMILKE